MRPSSQARRQQSQQPGEEAAPPADNNDNDATPPPPPLGFNINDDEFPSDYFARPLDEHINQALKRCIIDNRVLGEIPAGYGRADDEILPTFEQLRKFKSPRVRLRPIQQRQQQGEQSVSTDVTPCIAIWKAYQPTLRMSILWMNCRHIRHLFKT